MASSLEYVQHVAAQLSGAGAISYKKLFGEYGLWCGGTFFGTVENNQFYIKVTEAGHKHLPEAEPVAPHGGRPGMYLVEELDDRRTLVKKVEIVPLEVIIRNKVAGSFAKRMGLQEGMELKCPILEFSYKDDDLGDPMINDYMALAVGISTQEEIDEITRLAFAVNEELKSIFAAVDIELIDFKLEFGRYKGGIVLADEISPDTCRFWDIHTHDHLDKDRFRRDLGNVEDAYQEVYRRLGI